MELKQFEVKVPHVTFNHGTIALYEEQYGDCKYRVQKAEAQGPDGTILCHVEKPFTLQQGMRFWHSGRDLNLKQFLDITPKPEPEQEAPAEAPAEAPTAETPTAEAPTVEAPQKAKGKGKV